MPVASSNIFHCIVYFDPPEPLIREGISTSREWLLRFLEARRIREHADRCNVVSFAEKGISYDFLRKTRYVRM